MECPNCGAHIGRFELHQNCASCGINLFYSQQEYLLSQDAKKCELEFASFRVFLARLKTATIGGKLQIARLAMLLCCVGVLFIPCANLRIAMPIYSISFPFSALGIYNGFSGGLAALLDCLKIVQLRSFAVSSLLLLGTIALCAVSIGLTLVSMLLSFINYSRSLKAMKVFSVSGFAFSLLTVVFSLVSLSAVKSFDNGNIKISLFCVSFITAAFYATLMIINLIIVKKKIVPAYKEVDLLRIEIHKKVKSGELSLNDLPLPVFESEEEKQQRLADEKADAEREAAAEEQRKAGAKVNG